MSTSTVTIVFRVPTELTHRDGMESEIKKRVLPKMALRAIGNIKTRTSAGVDADGKRFRPYTYRYAALKRRFKRATEPVDLTWTGRMLGNLKITRTEKNYSKIYIGFSGTHPVNSIVVSKKDRQFKQKRTGREVPIAGVVAGNNRRRKFFALGARDRDDLKNLAVAEINKMIAEINRPKKA